MNPYIYMLIHTFLFWLQSTIKNPKSVAREQALLQEVYDTLGALLGALKSTLPPTSSPVP